MAILYQRRIQVEVAGLTITEPRIAVELERSATRTQDRGQCRIYNLSDQHADRIQDRGGQVTIHAGYPETVALLFAGEVQRVIRAREGLSHITRIALGDRVREVSRLGGVYFVSYLGQVSARQIAMDIINDGLGLEPGPLDAIGPRETVNNFYWGDGPADAALDALLRRLGLTWFEEDGVVRVNRLATAQSDAPTIMLSPETGLIERPIVTDEGAEVRMFLNARVVLGAIIQLQSGSLDGSWKVVAVRHAADNWDGTFETFCDLRALE